MKALKDATLPLTFHISRKDVDTAERGNKNFCVIAQALRKVRGISECEVGSRTTRIRIGNSTRRYITPENLRVALNTFDETGQWMLPEGEYRLSPPTPGRSLKRFANTKRSTGSALLRTRVNTPADLRPRINTRMHASIRGYWNLQRSKRKQELESRRRCRRNPHECSYQTR